MEEHEELVRTLASACTLLLKKDGSFPLDKPCPLALFGSGARHTVFGGTGSGEVNSRETISIERGLEEAGFSLTSKEWLGAYDREVEKAEQAFILDVKAEAKVAHMMPVIYGMGAVMPEPEYDLPLKTTEKTDTAIYVLSRISGEGADRNMKKGDFLLTDTEVRDIRALNLTYDRFLLVLNTGGPVDLSPVMDVKNILLLSQLGAQTGAILADLVLGKAYPSGKLSTTWAAAQDLSHIGTFGNPEDTLYQEGIYVGYRFHDTFRKNVLFPFGFGLSYTEFVQEVLSVQVAEGEEVTAQVRIRNTGTADGRQVVEAYVSKPVGRLDQPFQNLIAFAKTRKLAPGEEESLSLSFPFSSLASYSEEAGAWVLEKGDYILRIGTDSRTTEKAAVFTLSEDAVLQKAAPVFGQPGFSDLKPAGVFQHECLPADLPRFVLHPESLLQKQTEEDEASSGNLQKALARVQRMSDADVLRLNMGLFNERGGISGVVGNSAKKVPGAAGETTDIFEQDIPGLVMADGPAGLRISKDYFIDKNNVKHPLSNMFPASVLRFMPGVVKLFLKHTMEKKAPAEAEVRHQYCTAIPIGTALAQSFDTVLVEKLGDMVGSEMGQFGIQLWLAPALNIHRNVLCGRNFEYYSEDPLVSGKMAAAMTRGVQKHRRCGVTIKHFAANNQEFNRNFSNSCVSERALREIYLRGFEICVKEGKPVALMTSYNLINGVHTSEHAGLLQQILRKEWGYQGIVMTDWLIRSMNKKRAKYAWPDPAKVAAAGNDLYMPGSAGDMKFLQKGLSEGRVTREQLDENGARVLKLMLDFRESRR